ncbi:large conductance mechanosensitive channel protein MscL [Romeria aff. gracilis LEGE 07310]|uniref:Large-conductance mechanosensitive channel n=1 Tax=Vasconcelosia minhoensis LEGE 07310 TaxID=915328 RepID=A0A8J7ARU0_9CYAN|nr:large conductance mechanosensitive channel protein MscL [Romeria gracilis]MBE9079426.1 large conductance mechanosensitive channel protein MscL [Romeria aff. gracilis LEGE 07310]
MVTRQRTRAGGFIRDFKAFIMRGNVVDLAIAVIIGAAFGAIIQSLVDDIITPVILTPALQAANVDDIANLSYNGIKYGVFLSTVLNFIVISFALFVIIRIFERFKRKEEVQETIEPTVEERLNETLIRLNSLLERKL